MIRTPNLFLENLVVLSLLLSFSFDQLLQTVKNKNTVLNLVFKEFLQTSIPQLISVLYAKGYHDFPLRTFCLTVPNTGNLLCFRNFLISKKFMDKGEGGSIKIFHRIFFVSQCRKTRRGTLPCFRKILVSKNVRDKRGGDLRFSVEIILSHRTETFRRATLLFCVSEKIWQWKGLWIRGGGSIRIFRRNFLSHSAENFRMEPLSV